MPTPRLALVAVSAAVALAAAACGSSSSDAGVLAGKSPSQILQYALGRAKDQTYLQYALKSSGGSTTQTIDGEAEQNGGLQAVQTGSDQITVELVNGVAYFEGNAGGLEDTLGLSKTDSTTYADKWIEVTQSESLYEPITESVTILGILDQLKPSGTLVAGKPGKLAGHEAIGITGGLPGSTTSTSVTGNAELYVSTADGLPVGFSGQATSDGETIQDVAGFKWGTTVTLNAPASPVQYSSLPGTSS